MEDRENYFRRMDKLRKLIENKISYEKEFKTKDPFYNYGYREDFQKEEIMKVFELNTDEIILHPEEDMNGEKKKGQSGADFIIISNSKICEIKSGELKAGWHKAKKITKKNLGCVKFDKQNDDIRRDAIYEYDALGFSSFDKETTKIKYSIYVFGKDHILKIHPLLKREQEKKIKQIENLPKGKRLNRDDISVPVIDILNVLDDDDMLIIFNGEKITKNNFLNEVVK